MSGDCSCIKVSAADFVNLKVNISQSQKRKAQLKRVKERQRLSLEPQGPAQGADEEEQAVPPLTFRPVFVGDGEMNDFCFPPKKKTTTRFLKDN